MKHKLRAKHDIRESKFLGQYQEEEVVVFFRKHWIALLGIVGEALLFLFALPAMIIAGITLQFPLLVNIQETIYGDLFYLTALFVFIFEIHRVFLNLISYYFDMGVITTDRVIDVKKSVFIEDEYDSIDIVKIQDVFSRKIGIVKNFLNYGEITLNVEHGVHRKHFYTVPNPTRFVNLISEHKKLHIQDRRYQRHKAESVMKEVTEFREDMKSKVFKKE